MTRAVIMIALAVLGCSTIGPSTIWDPHDQVQSRNSSSYRTGTMANGDVTIRAMISQSESATAYALGLIVARSDLNYPKITKLKSFGRTLPYRKLDRHRIGPLRAEIGLIPLSGAEFQRLAQTGITFRIYGKRGQYEVNAPARLFREALAQ